MLLVMRATDYERVASAIGYIAKHRREQPTLERLGEEMGLSQSHLQRVFSRWAGISPKRFLQYVTNEHAKALLKHTTALDAALEVGLSGTGRLHDLTVACDAMTPGELGSDGAGLVIRYGTHPTPFGGCLLALTRRGICKLAFFDTVAEERRLEAQLCSEWPCARIVRDDSRTSVTAQQVFTRDLRRRKPLHLLLKGTNFQIKVWEALLAIPPGNLVDYRSLARGIGCTRGARAVGTAVARNNIAYLIPCHRVIRSSGQPNQYRWGSERKRALIVWESASRQA